MNIFVFVKRVPDTESKIRIDHETGTIVEEGLNFVLNPYDEYAVEEALRLREAKGGVEFLSSSAHVTQGGVELELLRESRRAASGRIRRPGKHTTKLAFSVPEKRALQCTANGKPCAHKPLARGVIELIVTYQDSADFEVRVR